MVVLAIMVVLAMPRKMQEKITVKCDLCGSEQHRLLFVKEGFRHVRCADCGMVFVNPRLAEHLNIQTISGTGCMGDDSVSTSQQKRFQKELSTMEPFRRLNRIIEIGPGQGWFLVEASRAGWDILAVEINAQAIKFLKRHGIKQIIAQAAEDFLAQEDSIDVVRMWDVIEHLRSPRKALTNVYRMLRHGGLLKLATTNFASMSRWLNGPEWVYLNGSDHIFLFEPRTMTRLLEDVGFREIEVRTRSFNMRRKLYHPENELPVRFPFLIPFRKLIDATVGLTGYGHQMIVTAVKPR
jgi:2-polyprenyl-3-methyl-5-hydroxy-6-metoxy-1,4-benzoquinol methylase